MKYELSISDMEVLRRYQRNVRGGEYVKVTCILMLSKGCSAEFISECLGIDRSAVYRYWNLYKTNSLESFLDNRQKGYWGLLSSHESGHSSFGIETYAIYRFQTGSKMDKG